VAWRGGLPGPVRAVYEAGRQATAITRGHLTNRGPEPAGYADGPMSVAPRRVVTGHDPSGRSVVLSDAPTPKTLDIGTAAFHEVWIADGTPVAIGATEPEPTERPVRTPPPAGGVLVRFTEMAPGAESPMHRTETVDVGVVLEGETLLLLDDGSETRLGPGDAVVQRATNHAWANRSDRPVRMMFVMIDGAVADELGASAAPLEFFDQVLG
jgi:quercetin dioxygenase-like cupin family protein